MDKVLEQVDELSNDPQFKDLLGLLEKIIVISCFADYKAC